MNASTARRTALASTALLLAVYIATLAPDVTFWDAGEFIAAAHSLGIPHPPGTPVFVVLLHAWASALRFLPYAVATNLFSAVCTAGAAGLAAWFVARATGDGWAGAAAALVAGGMSSVWSNATETEVYAAALALVMVSIVAAERAGRTGERRWLLLTAYLVAFAVPVHLSALVAAPVLVYLVARPPGEFRWEAIDWSAGLVIAGVAIMAAAVGRLSPWLGIVGVLAVAAAPRCHPERAQRAPGCHPERAQRARDLLGRPRSLQGEKVPQSLRSFGMTARRLRSFGMTARRLRSFGMTAVESLAVAALALSALAFLLIRARHDPLVNQANPSTLSQLGYVIARRQYDLAPLWPRRAPVWAQIANWFEYADWQTALSLGPTVIPTVARVLATVVCAVVALIGARWHRAVDKRTWWAVLLLFLCGSVGVIAYLNLRPSPSFGWGVLPAAITREARERDYFFVLSFWAWGLWAGMGAVHLARRWKLSAATGAAAALLPIALNWSAVNRRQQPEAGEARELATALLGAAPPHAVLFVAGDNDSYPLWYLQDALGVRRDVTSVTTPLLAASWYAAELQRRYALGPAAPIAIREQPVDRYAAARAIAAAAREQGRPVAAALTLPQSERRVLLPGASWRVAGLVAVADTRARIGSTAPDASAQLVVDSAATLEWARQIATWRRGRAIEDGVDPVHEYFGRVLDCPRQILDSARVPSARASLDSLCNF